MSKQPIFVRGWLPAWGVEAMRLSFAALYKILFRVEVYGRENLPPSGGLILSANHLSYIDTPLVFILMKGRKATVFAADKYRPHPIYRRILEAVDCIWVHRGAIGPSTIKIAVQVLRNGSILGVAPEGTRSLVTHALQPGKTGAAYLSLAAGVPVVPIALTGTDKGFQTLLRLRRARLTATIGEPMAFTAPGDGHRPDAKLLDDYTTELMCRIAAMLPSEYRGVYAEHPRLKELLMVMAREEEDKGAGEM